MSKRKYRIGHLLGTIYAEYPSMLYKGCKDVILREGHTFIRLADQMAMQREMMDYDEVMLSFLLAKKMELDAYLISPGSIFQLFKDVSKSAVDELIKILPPERTIIMESHYDGYRCLEKDNIPGMRECMRHLIDEMGYKHIAFISGQEGSNSSTQRENIYWEEVKRAGLDVDESYFRRATYWGQCEDVVDDLLDAHPDIDAIACAVDRIAYSCYNSITARNLVVGKDIAVTGFDDLSDSALMNPPLTSVRCSAYDIGGACAMEALRLCEGLKQEQFKFNSKLIVRASSDPNKDSTIKVSLASLFKQNPIPWDEIVDEFVRLSWKKNFGDEYKRYKRGITNIFIHFDEAYKRYLKTKDASVSLFKENQLKDFLLTAKAQNDFSLVGLQTAFYDLYQVIKASFSLEAQLYFSEQYSLLNMLISRIFYEDLKNVDSVHTSEEALSMQIMEDAFIFSNDRDEAVKHILQHVKSLGFTYALLYNLAKPIIVEENPVLSNENLYLQGMLWDGQITTYASGSVNVAFEDIINNQFSDDQFVGELTVCPLVSEGLTTGFVVLDEKLNPFRQHVITQMLAYSSRHIYMIEQELEMIKLLNKNNIILEKESLRDVMTGLYNRRGFIRQTDASIRKLLGKTVAFFYMDLDGLKGINDTLGHDLGDSAIRSTATILKSSFRESDILCRMGGDEFVAFAKLDNESDAKAISDRIYSKMDKYNEENDNEYKLSISIGYKLFIANEDNIKHLSTLLKEADKMLYDNKKAKKRK